jgi:hypothetical protein
LAAGNVLLLALLLYEKGLIRPTFEQSPFRRLFTAFFYFLGASVFAVAFVLSENFELSLLIVATYFYFLVLKYPTYPPLRRNLVYAYCIACLSAALVIVVYTLAYPAFDSYESALVLFATSIIGVVAHKRRATVRAVIRKTGGRTVHLWAYQFLVALTYAAIAYHIFRDWLSPALSVVLVVHATVLLFLTLKPRYECLTKLMLGFYGLAIVKIIFMDLSEASLIEKVIAFLIIGVLLLAGAYQFQKFRGATAARGT